MNNEVTCKPDVKGFFDPGTFTISYVVSDPDTRRAAIVDSVLDYDPKAARTSTQSADAIIAHIKENGLVHEWHLETHAHADHLSAAPYLKEKLGGRIAIGENIAIVQRTFKKILNLEPAFATNGSQFDHLFKDGEAFRIGKLEARAIHTPGHTPACLTYLIGDAAFVGDTLFMPDSGTGRCDFPGGDAHMLYRSIRKLFALPAQTRLYICHDYQPGGRAPLWQTTVAEEREKNIHVHDGVREEEFVATRNARDETLDMPLLILPAVQINMRAGQFPRSEDNGVSYLKIPLNQL
ncbi:glyoxylase-like metal-dependent hydrolase (beta-lactamase superfamily II) [Bradyrhizobium macuxiense]|uniref:Glyoxylase-like metal-dependent hydrolase (Beta-lactamase superfamily II) n=1 Tax=Bradyrhizobium macuxiense TaxID=1755647 RepID=A0A560KUR0_9BRAD|nr:MBL fold metallo-hydrolase [Bradyrhizobium macuxiense]TWB86889.1 glyoxylase-like metal-dependent hydrolase (beta-lactamase superfamily II) [Bradyrhizobium macuxiense]